MISTANTFVDLLTAGKFQQATGYLDAVVKPALPAPKLQLAWQALTMQYGPLKKRLPAFSEPLQGHTIVFVPVVFGTTTLDVKIVFSGSSKVSGFFIESHRGDYKEAPYVKSQSFSDQKVKIGTGKWQLDGALSLPNGEGPFAAVILVHGSGPHDMDESVGPNKPFRDLAHGLASEGIAVVRYEKRTKQHGKEITTDELKRFTVKEESVDDAVEAAKMLRSNPKIDKSKIFVLGHSLGGYVIPRIAAADKELNGFIMMAGNNEPVQDAIVRQTQYIASLSGGQNPALIKQMDGMKVLAEKIRKLTDADAGTATVILGAAPTYWLDLKAHDPLVEVKNVDRPILFLQGGRDYQVTADGDFVRWKDAIKSAGKESQCEFKVYPLLNHLMIAGKGVCTPAEYTNNFGNVDANVVQDIASWVKRR
jgi:dienelactone hydrolase